MDSSLNTHMHHHLNVQLPELLQLYLSVRCRMPTLLRGPGCNLGQWWRVPPSCALLGGFAIGAQVLLL